MPGDKLKPTSGCLSDTATGEDSLGFKPYVEAIVEFLTADGTRPPITLSIEGQWGCGKSSFMRQLQKEINKKNEVKEEPKYFTVWFNSWKYDKEDELWASFALNLMDELSKQLPWGRRQISRLDLLRLRYKLKLKSNFLIIVHFLWSILSFILIFSFLFLVITYVLHYLGLALPYFITEDFFQKFAQFVLISAPLVGLMKYFSTYNWFIDVFRDPFGLKKIESNANYKERISFREHFLSDFNEIIKSYARDSKVYVFVDDLDRCEVPKAAELMQAINLMISDDSRVYFSLGMDRKVISAGLAAKNEQVIKCLGVDGLKYGYDFIEKFIQLPFKVPSPKSTDFLKFLTSPEENESSPNPSEPVDKSSISEDFTLNSVSLQNENNGQETWTDSNKQEIKNDKDCVEDYETSKLILEIVSLALDNNPRRIKQFINQFRFQKIIGKRIGFFSYDEGTDPKYMWNCKKLAKFVAISIKWPSLISDLSSNVTFIEQLQEYALKPEKENRNEEEQEEKKETKRIQGNFFEVPGVPISDFKGESRVKSERKIEEKKKMEEKKKVGKWNEDKKLIELLSYGCVEGGNISKDIAEYTLSGLDFSKLLQISPVTAYFEEGDLSGSLPEPIREMEFVLMPTEEFVMGSPKDEGGRYDSEGPTHKVSIKNPFYLGKYPVTQKQWVSVMGNNPSHFKGDERPVENVSWSDVQRFIKKLNYMAGNDKYCLPSEAEWEYSCRAGTTTRFHFDDDELKLRDYSWYSSNSGNETHPVGQKKSNPWGLCDMHGNVWEWVQDRWHDNYEGAPSDGSSWEDGGSSNRVRRGGGWFDYDRSCRSAIRFGDPVNFRYYGLGFRILRNL